ncbi:MAG TPA: AMP-binding protein, partial [Gemmataceae bacterium]|nr:AMP-binding protein [Gemmataceae bacterium]
MLLGRMLSEACQQAPQTIALWFGPRKWSYAELDQATDRIAGGLLAAGVHSGDRLALFLPNSPELMLTYFACFKIGAITVPLNYRYRKAEVEYSVGHSKATSLVVHPSLVQEVDDSALGHLGMRRFYLTGTGPVRPGFAPFDDLSAGPAGKLPGPAFDEQQPAAILYTSGTTAKPKGVTYSHGSLWHNCVIQCATFEFGAADVHLVSTAACHAAAFTGQLLPNVLARGTSVLTHLPTPEQVVQATRAHGVTRAQMLPAS